MFWNTQDLSILVIPGLTRNPVDLKAALQAAHYMFYWMLAFASMTTYFINLLNY